VMGMACYVIYYVLMYAVGMNTLATLTAIIFGFAVYVIFMAIINGFNKNDLALMPMGHKLVRWIRL